MQVLKFGGSSVATAPNLQRVARLVEAASQQAPTVVVVSALGGTTDALIEAGRLAATGSEEYRTTLKQLEERHLEAVRGLLPIPDQSGVPATPCRSF